MAYINSDKITVFPSAKRGVLKPESRITTEANFVSIINKLINSEGFVISDTFDTSNPNAIFEFNIKGYYFCLNPSALITAINNSSATSIYATIKLVDVGGSKELYGVDTAQGYEGVVFSTAAPSPQTDEYTLKLVSRTSSAAPWEIEPDSTVRFDQRALNLVVDGGEI